MLHNKSLTLITTCKGRESFLEQVLPTWITIPEIDKIVVVDYNSPGNKIQPIIDKNQNGNIFRVKIKDQPNFSLSIARNVGLRSLPSDSQYLFFCDCDIQLDKDSLALVSNDNCFYLRDYKVKFNQRWSIAGSFICTYDQISSINGYDERLWGHGHEDQDVYERLNLKYPVKHVFTPDMFKHIDHGNEIRNTYYGYKSPTMTSLENIKITRMKSWDETFIQQQFECQITYPNGNIEDITL
jgi:predicted glycosyltransferase involved in capsule biosynthesis